MASTNPEIRKFEQELVLEYIREHHLLQCKPCNINDKIDEIKKVSKIISQKIDSEYKDFNLFV